MAMRNDNDETGIVRHAGAAAQPMGLAPQNMAEAHRLATAFAASGMFAAKSPEAALVVLLTGLELGLGPAQAMRSIHVIEGKPSLSAQLMVALCVRRRDVCEYFRLIEGTDQRAEYETKRVGCGPVRMAWTIEQAKVAGLVGKGNWAKFPGAMLRARCGSMLARDVYPDVLANLYDPDELAPDVVIAAPQPPSGRRSDMRAGETPCPQSVLDDLADAADGEGYVPPATCAAILLDRAGELGAEDYGAAFDACQRAAKCSAAELKRALSAAKAPAPANDATPAPSAQVTPADAPDPVAQAERDFDLARSRAEVDAIAAEVGRMGLRKGSAEQKRLHAAYKAAVARLCAALRPPPEDEPPPDGTDNGGGKRPGAGSTADAAGDAAASDGAAAGSVALATWEAHWRAKAPHAVAASYALHRGEWEGDAAELWSLAKRCVVGRPLNKRGEVCGEREAERLLMVAVERKVAA